MPRASIAWTFLLLAVLATQWPSVRADAEGVCTPAQTLQEVKDPEGKSRLVVFIIITVLIAATIIFEVIKVRVPLRVDRARAKARSAGLRAFVLCELAAASDVVLPPAQVLKAC